MDTPDAALDPGDHQDKLCQDVEKNVPEVNLRKTFNNKDIKIQRRYCSFELLNKTTLKTAKQEHKTKQKESCLLFFFSD